MQIAYDIDWALDIVDIRILGYQLWTLLDDQFELFFREP